MVCEHTEHLLLHENHQSGSILLKWRLCMQTWRAFFDSQWVSKCKNGLITIHASFKTRMLLLTGQVGGLPLLLDGLLYLALQSWSGVQGLCQKKKKKFQHLHPHCSSSLEWPVIPLLILSSRFRRLSCNICLIFHLSKMYHCECTKVTKLWVASTAHIYTFYTSWHFASFWNCKWKGNSSSVLNLLVGRSNQSVSVSNRKSSVLGSFLLLKHV